MEQNDTITNSETSSTTTTPNSVISSAATEVFRFLKHSLVEDDPVSSFVSRLVQEVIRLRHKFAIAFPHNLPKVSTLLETIKNLRDVLKQRGQELKELKDFKEEFEQRCSTQKPTTARLEQELTHAKEDMATLLQLTTDVRCRQLIMIAPLLFGEESETAHNEKRDRTYQKAGDLGAHGAQIKADLILAEARSTFRSHIESAYAISLPPMLALFNLSNEARQIQTHQVKIHPGSFHLIKACIEHRYHFNMLLADPSDDLFETISMRHYKSGIVSLPLRIDHLTSIMSTRSQETFSAYIGYDERYDHIDTLMEDAREHYMEYAEKVHRAVQGRLADLYYGAISGKVNEISAEQLDQEWWKDPAPLSLEAVNVLRHLILAIDCLFKPWTNLCKGRVWPPQKSWDSAQGFYGPALVSKNNELTETMVSRWE